MADLNIVSSDSRSKHILVGCTGSVASIKLPLLVTALLDTKDEHDVEVRVVSTEHARHFFSRDEILNSVDIYFDEDEWTAWSGRGDPVLHIDLSKWADLFVIAPLDANTLAKISQGLCDNLLTCIARAWDISKPLMFCPAMNTKMWEHPTTATSIAMLKSWGYLEVPCISKTLVCGDKGLGAMAEVATIVTEVHAKLGIQNVSASAK